MKELNLSAKTQSYFFLLVGIIIFITSCNDSSCPTCPDKGHWNNNNNIYGSGNLISEERIVPIFNSINHGTVGEVNITYGAVQEVIVTTDDNIQKYIRTDVKQGKLNIYIDCDSGLSDFSLTIDIVLNELKELAANSAGNIKSTNKFIAENVFLYLNSAGNIQLNLETNELHSNISSAGNLFLKGKAVNHYARLNSAGNLFAYDFETDTTIINVNSAGNAYVKVTGYLDVSLTSLGSLYYKGHPDISEYVSSIGRVINSN